MFKKKIEVKSSQKLSGADWKYLKRTVREKFIRASDADIDTLLPPKVEVAVSKLQNRALVYYGEGGVPMFFDIDDGRGREIYPTVYAMWKIPELLPCFTLKGPEVSRFIIGGADLMFPGIELPSNGLPDFSAGEQWAVKVPGNPAPIAVGATTMTRKEAENAGWRGKALWVTHYYRDLLWEFDGHYVPNDGFLADVVREHPTPSLVHVSYSFDASSAPLMELENEATIEEEYADTSNEIHHVEQLVVGTNDLNITDNFAHAAECPVEEQPTLSNKDMDGYLEKSLLQALHTTVKESDLPMPGSTLWAGHILPCRPLGVTLDVKKSTHKKLSKWLQAESSFGLISVQEDKHRKETVLISVNRVHPSYTSFKPERRPEHSVDQNADQASGASRAQKLLEISKIYKPSIHVNPVFASVGADRGKFYTAPEASGIVSEYVENKNLVKAADKSVVILDPILCDALFKGSIKKGSRYPTEIRKHDLGLAFLNRMQAHYRVAAPGGEVVVRKGSLRNMQIMTERRQGNKKVTRVSGLEIFLLNADALASELQKKFACSTSVAELPGKKGHEVIVQGGVIDAVARYLMEHYGVPKQYIEVLDKTNK